jgi:hypothetical protein
MAKWIRIEHDWAFWVDADSFECRRIRNGAPIFSIVIAKTKKDSKEKSSYIKTAYGIVSRFGLVKINKKTASEILSNRAIDYIQKTGQWPPCMNIKRILNSGIVELSFTLSKHDTFTLKVTADMVNGNPLDFLLGLKQYEKPEVTQGV